MLGFSHHSTRFALALMGAVCVLASCSNYNSSLPPTAEFSISGSTVSVRNLEALSDDRFTLVNLQNRTIVANSDSATAKWDVGFRKTTIIVNGGKIRTGAGGLLRLTGQSYDALKEAPASTYRTDNAEDDLALVAKSGEGWYNYSFTTIAPISNVVLVIRTADGMNYAKMEIQGYYKDNATPSITGATRYYTFRYQVQTGGSRQFQ